MQSFNYLNCDKIGYSGARILIDPVVNAFIKQDVSGSNILQYQRDVLTSLSPILKGKLRVPKVLAFSSVNGVQSLSLELIKGKTLYQLFMTGELIRGNSLTRTLWFEWAKTLRDNRRLIEIPINNDQRTLNERIDRIRKAAVRFGIDQDKDFILSLNSVKDIRIHGNECCHGDFTLQNVLVSDEYLYLIDFIPSPFPSLEQDLSKLVQDGIGGWAGRFNTNDSFNFELFLIVDSLIKDAITINAVDYSVLRSLSYFSMLRILPYVVCSSDIIRWKKCLKNLKNYFE